MGNAEIVHLAVELQLETPGLDFASALAQATAEVAILDHYAQVWDSMGMTVVVDGQARTE